METVLLVGEISGTAGATLVDRGYEIRRVDEERLLTDGNGRSRERSTDRPEQPGREDRADAAEGEPIGDHERVASGSLRDASSAIVTASEGDLDAIRTLGNDAPELPVLFAVQTDDSAAAGAALEAGADDRVLLDGEHDGDRIARRLQGLVGTTPGADGAIEPGDDGGHPAPGTPGAYDSAHDDRIGALLEGARDLMDADDANAVADTAVETAKRALGYDVVGVVLLDGQESIRHAAYTTSAEELFEDADRATVLESAVRPAIEEGRTLELDEASLGSSGFESLGSALLFPLGTHGVLGFAAASPNAFGQGDRHVGELLAANTRAALDRIDRVERIEAIHGATREMIDARRPVETAERAVDAARSILGYRFVVCFLEDEETGRLEPVAWTDETAALTDGEIPTPGDSDGAVEAFETGGVVWRDSGDDGPASGLPVTSRLHVPIDGHGTVLVAAPGGDGFDESDVQLARMLATNTARALDRVDRTQELRRFETAFETVDDMVYLQDEAGEILHCTPALAEHLGYDRDEVVGRSVADFVDDEAVAEGVALIEELLDEPHGTSRTQRLRFDTADGETVPLEVDVSLLPGEEYRGVVGAVQDISDLLAVRERLDSQQNRFEYLFENIPDPVVEANLDDGEATVISVNTAFEETFGYDAEALAGQPLNEAIVPESDRDRARRIDARAAAGEIRQAELERETQYGHREFLFRGVPYADGDGAVRGFGIYTDITEQKERERHLEVLQRLLRHNVRNDVNVLLAGIDQLDDALDDPDGREAELLETLEDSAAELLSMSKKAKRISRVIDAETEELDVVDLSTIARSVAEQVDRLDPDATIELDVPGRCRVLGSAAIERAVEELLGNAIQHAGSSPTVTLSIECEPDSGSLTVADDGPGIPDAERDVLEDGEITPLKHGSGLGLWLVTHATEASGGTVSFDDEEGGARVTLSFRRSMDDE